MSTVTAADVNVLDLVGSGHRTSKTLLVMNALFGLDVRAAAGHYRSTSSAVHHSIESNLESGEQSSRRAVDVEVCCRSTGNGRRVRRCHVLTVVWVGLLLMSLIGGVVVTLVGYGPLRHWLEKSRDGDKVEQLAEASDFRKSSLIVSAQILGPVMLIATVITWACWVAFVGRHSNHRRKRLTAEQLRSRVQLHALAIDVLKRRPDADDLLRPDRQLLEHFRRQSWIKTPRWQSRRSSSIVTPTEPQLTAALLAGVMSAHPDIADRKCSNEGGCTSVVSLIEQDGGNGLQDYCRLIRSKTTSKPLKAQLHVPGIHISQFDSLTNIKDCCHYHSISSTTSITDAFGVISSEQNHQHADDCRRGGGGSPSRRRRRRHSYGVYGVENMSATKAAVDVWSVSMTSFEERSSGYSCNSRYCLKHHHLASAAAVSDSDWDADVSFIGSQSVISHRDWSGGPPSSSSALIINDDDDSGYLITWSRRRRRPATNVKHSVMLSSDFLLPPISSHVTSTALNSCGELVPSSLTNRRHSMPHGGRVNGHNIKTFKTKPGKVEPDEGPYCDSIASLTADPTEFERIWLSASPDGGGLRLPLSTSRTRQTAADINDKTAVYSCNCKNCCCCSSRCADKTRLATSQVRQATAVSQFDCVAVDSRISPRRRRQKTSSKHGKNIDGRGGGTASVRLPSILAPHAAILQLHERNGKPETTAGGGGGNDCHSDDSDVERRVERILYEIDHSIVDSVDESQIRSQEFEPLDGD